MYNDCKYGLDVRFAHYLETFVVFPDKWCYSIFLLRSEKLNPQNLYLYRRECNMGLLFRPS